MVRAPSLAEKMVPSYRISLTRFGEGASAMWLAEIEGFPNCSARAAAPEEAVRRAWIAAEAVIARGAEGADEAQQSTSGSRHSGKLLVRMPATLHDELAHTAEREGVSLNQLINGVLASSVEWRTSTDDAPTLWRAGLKRDSTASEDGGGGHWLAGRMTPIALAVNFGVVLVAATAAIVLIVIALRDSW